MAKSPFFSVIIPAYNSEETLGRTIGSVLFQTFTDFELILIDDGSTDGTSKLVSTFVDSRIFYKKILNSGGPARPRNVGLNLASGTWICFLDSDDVWEPHKLEVAFKNIQLRPEVDLWTSGYYVFNQDGSIYERFPSKLVNEFSLKTLLIYSNPFVTSAIVLKKEKIGVTLFDESREIASVEDLDFLVALSKKYLSADKINEILVGYFYNEYGISKNYEAHLMSLCSFHRKQLRDLEDKHHFRLFKIRVKSNFYWIQASIRMSQKRHLSFLFYLLISFVLSPYDRISYFLKTHKG